MTENANLISSDHPTTVKRRFLSVSVVMLISPFFVYYLLCYDQTTNVSIWEIMGFRTSGVALAICVPFLLTATLFLGSICSLALNGTLITYAQPSYWIESVQNILWLRNHIVAPLSEEFTFRACMMPLLLQSFSPKTAIFLTPLFFGVAHLHHNIERVRSGMDVKTAIIVSSKSTSISFEAANSMSSLFSGFQFAYTGIFGIYSAYLFARSGHFIAPFIAHAFCNHMGFPDIQEVMSQTTCKKVTIIAFYVIGLVSWILLLPIATEPKLYENNLYWKIAK